GDLWINGAGLTLSAFGPTDIDLSPFILNATGLLAAGASIGPFPLLTVSVPALMPPGEYPGAFTIQGGGNSNADGLVGSGSLRVVVTPEPVPVPEPDTLLLTAIGLSTLCFFQWRGRGRGSSRQH